MPSAVRSPPGLAGCTAVASRWSACHRSRAAASASAELVTRGVTAEVIVVVEEQDACVVAHLLAKKYAAASPLMPQPTNQIICLMRVSDGAGLLPKRAVPQRVCQLPRAVVAPAYACEGRRIVRGDPAQIAPPCPTTGHTP